MQPAPAPATGATASPVQPGDADNAEHRYLTVLFCDLIDSTLLADRLDPEDLRAVVLQYQQVAGSVIERYEGHIAQYLGDGLLAYFGYPSAHEDDARRALYASLEIIDGIVELSSRLRESRNVEIAVRIGIHSGKVVAGDVGTESRSERLAVGQTPNIAARLQAESGPNEVLLSAQTADIVNGYFRLENLGVKPLKGVSERFDVYRLIAETNLGERFGSTTRNAMSPFVGREQERAQLLEIFDRIEAGRGEVVLVSGEAGIGKSRLIQAFSDDLGNRARWTTLSCSPYHTNSALFPISIYLSRFIGVGAKDSDGQRLAQVREFARERRYDEHMVVSMLAPILAYNPGPEYPDPALSPKQRKDRTFATLNQILREGSEQHPLVLMVEDLHWIDHSTLEFLDYLAFIAPTRPILMLLSCRPEFKSPWTDADAVTKIELQPLRTAEVEDLIQQLVGDSDVPDWVRSEIAIRTDGVPIFVEELIKTVLGPAASGLLSTDADSPLAGVIPTTLQGSLTARLDAIGDAKDVLQLASVLGRSFSFDLLAEVWHGDQTSLARALQVLLREQLLIRTEDREQPRFRFRHALIQDAAYESMLRLKRRQLHGVVAQVMLEQFAELSQRRPEVVAHHLTRANQPDRAIAFWLQAGQNAAHRSALPEAISLFRRGIALLPDLTPGTDALRLEQRLQVGLGNAIANATHWGNPESALAFERALAVCQELGDEEKRFRCMLSLRMNYSSQGRHLDAAQQAETALSLTSTWNNRAAIAQARAANILPEWHLGRFANAEAHALAGLEALEDLPVDRFSREQQLYIYAYVTQALWVLGKPERCEEVMSLGDGLLGDIDDPYASSFFLAYGSTALVYLRKLDLLEQRLDVAQATAEEHGFGAILDWARIQRGWLTAQRGHAEEGLEVLQSGIDSYLERGAGSDRPLCQLLLAETLLLAGRRRDAARAVDEALARSDDRHEMCHNAEAYRVRGNVLQAMGKEAEARSDFERAIRISEEQGALGWQLRSSLSLARVLARAADATAARAVLEPICARYPKNCDMQDLLDAQGLLGELAGNQT